MDFRFPNLFTAALLASFASTAGVLAFFYDPLPADNPEAYQACIVTHPQRYCEYAHLPSKYEAQ